MNIFLGVHQVHQEYSEDLSEILSTEVRCAYQETGYYHVFSLNSERNPAPSPIFEFTICRNAWRRQMFMNFVLLILFLY